MRPSHHSTLTLSLLLKPLWLGIVLILPVRLQAADLAAVVSSASNDLQRTVAELSTVRQQVESERMPLARRVTELEQKLADRRADFGKAERFQESKLLELNLLKKDAKERADAVKYVESILNEYGRTFHGRLSFVEEPKYKPLFDAAEKAAATADLAPAEKFAQRFALLSAAVKRAEGALGGEQLDGKALDQQGRVQQGKVALIGPVAVFASLSGGVAGVLQQELNKADPTVVQIDKNLDAASRELAVTGKGQLVLDPTLGTAFRLSALQESLYHKLAQGGLIMIPLLGLGAGAVLLALVKWFQLSRVRVASGRDLQVVLRHVENNEQTKALEHARRIPGLAGNLLATAVQHYDEKKEYIEEVLYEKMLGARTQLERGIAFLALAATTGPLLGLLGTVMGMIATFKMISSVGSGDPKQLAAGISEALICTATGMAVAIPSLLFHAFLSRKAKGILGSMEQTAVGFVNGIPDREEKPVFAGAAD